MNTHKVLRKVTGTQNVLKCLSVITVAHEVLCDVLPADCPATCPSQGT